MSTGTVENPTIVGSVTSTNLGGARAVAYSDGYCYVAAFGSDRLTVVDVSNPSSPTVVGSTTGPNAVLDNAWSIAYSGGYCYVGTTLGRLVVVDVFNPSNPTVIGSVTDATLNDIRGVTYSGGYCYVADSFTDRLVVVDVSNPESPTVVGSITGATLNGAWSVAHSGWRCYVASNSSDSITVVDVSNPSSPTVVGSVISATLDGAYGVAYSDGYCYVAASNANQLVVVEATPSRTPYAPTLVTPANGAVLDFQRDQVFDWQFNDPDTGDTQSAYNFAYRPSGASAWVETGWLGTGLSQRTIVAGTFTVGGYEWRVRTRDSQGLESPWSTTGFFTTDYAPAGPSITDPVNGATIITPEYTVVWSVPDQDAYQLQVLDEAETVLFDTGQVDQPTARSRVVQFPDNQVTRSIRVRVLYGGLWSPWYTVTVTVSYTPPAVPFVVTVEEPDLGSISVSAVHPAPVDPEPTVVSWDVWVRGGPEGEIRLAAGLPPSADYRWWLPVSGVDYEFRARAVGDNGTASWSEWTSTSSLTPLGVLLIP
jgi:hypothetical protein